MWGQGTDPSGRPRSSARCRSLPIWVQASRSSTRCAPPCSPSASASLPVRRPRSSRTPTTSRCSTPPAARRTGTRPPSSSATTSRTGPPSTSWTRPTPPRSSSSTDPTSGSGGPRRSRSKMVEAAIDQRRPEGPGGVRDDVRGGAAVRRLARPALRDPGGARVRLRALGRARLPGRRPATRSRCRCASCTWRGTPRCSCPPRGAEEARAVVESRSGAAYEPRLAELAARNLDEMLAELDDTRMWEHRARERARAADLALGRPDRRRVRDDRRDHRAQVAVAARALDRRGRARRGRRVALRAPGRLRDRPAARRARPRPRPRRRVSNAIWEKPGPLGFGEWERVRLHAHYTERAFAQSPALAPIGRLAGSHHERLDGSGYHRGSRGPDLDRARPHPGRRRLLHGHARGPAVQAGARRRGGGDRAPARGAGGTARLRGRRRGARRRRAPRLDARRASCRRA